MGKKVTFTAKKVESIEEFQRSAALRKTSLSEEISNGLDILAPFYAAINSHIHIVNEIERNIPSILNKCLNHEVSEKDTLNFEKALWSIWENNIRQQQELLEDKFYIHKMTGQRMGKIEVDQITKDAEDLVAKFGAQRVIWIYTDRRVNNKHLKAGGISNIIIINKTNFGGYYFDINHTVIIPLIDLSIYGATRSIKNKGVKLLHSYLCWIPIYHTNNMAVMVPVLEDKYIHSTRQERCIVTIINPFNEEIRNI